MAANQNDVASSSTTLPPITTTGATIGTATGLILSTTDAIRAFLTSASINSYLSEDLKKLSSSFINQPSVPYKSLKSIWFGSNKSIRPELSALLSGANFVLTSPKPREKSEELKARLKKLEEVADRKAYQELVKDITPKKGIEEPFSSYKDQLGFGMHVIVTMFSGYLLGFAAFRALFNKSPAMSAAGGILGLVVAMLVETLLFIIRASNQDLRPSSSVSKIKKNQ